MTSAANTQLMFPDEVLEQIKVHNIISTLEIPGGHKQMSWFCLVDKLKKKTKNGKTFWRFKVMDNLNNTGWVRLWGDFKDDKEPDKYTLCVGEIHNDIQWGMSSSCAKITQLNIK